VRSGTRLGVDVGDVRVGVAASDRSGLLATPVETLRRGEGDLQQLVALTAEHEALEVVVGLPRSLSGQEGPAAGKARAYAGELADALAAAGSAATVRLCDERMSTVTATHQLREHGGRGKKHGKRRRAVVDQAAAVVILQNALDTERATGVPPGEQVC
jgi:putative holliday junction resolvase